MITNQHVLITTTCTCDNGHSYLLFVSCRCRPSVLQMLKWAWVQFLATYIVLWYLLSWLEWVVFRFRVVETRVVADTRAASMKF